MSCKQKDLRERTDSDRNTSMPQGCVAEGLPRLTVAQALPQWAHSSWVGGGKEPRAGERHRTEVILASVPILGPNG